MNPKINTLLGLLLIVSCAFAAGYFVWNFSQFNVVTDDLVQYQNVSKKEMNVCTMEAKLCPDGSYVSRSGPRCEFAPCKNEEAAACVKEGESIGAVYPGVKSKKCCDGLTPKIPEGLVGTQGICTKTK